ncbi:endonuclease III [Granulicella mallensis]|uniref:Endonuclease III n=1 Tax=Granulicella mallensis (strain ATCC BAA-1857 / DSM 23137 / MP5ACTX8) TaxID=682795 RepID=G8NVM9_GRAMM|nr:endonuclease III [Granulicella mallensis]AEU37701.1 endonuclease III [Granulicella mallensis MP5ACTX8]
MSRTPYKSGQRKRPTQKSPAVLRDERALERDRAVSEIVRNVLTPPQRLKPAARKAAIEGVPAAKARKIAAKEPVAPKAKRGKTAKPLAPERVAAILDALRKTYPNVVCALTHRNAFELTIATALSAQTTDVTVNKVTPELFKMFPTPKALAEAPLLEIERIIHTTGFYRAKAKNIKGAAQVLVEKFNSQVPKTIEEMIQLPGVARKTANVVLGSWFGIPSGVVVDTHVLRISRRLELTQATEPVKVEQDLQKVIPQDRWIQFSHELIHHGRQVCIARKPKCVDCSLEKLCNSADKTWSSH